MNDREAIRRELRTALLTATGVTEAIIAGENRPFTPPAAPGLHIHETLVETAERQHAYDQLHAVGLYRLGVRIGAGEGTEEVDTLLDAIGTVFKPTTSLTVVTSVQIYRTEPGTGAVLTDTPYYEKPLFIYWRHYGTL